MESKHIIELVGILSWPIVGLVALIYVWRSDAIGKLLRISSAVDDLKARISDLVEAEERLATTINNLPQLTGTIDRLEVTLLNMNASVENIQDRVDRRTDTASIEAKPANHEPQYDLEQVFASLESAWKELSDTLEERFGWFDRRSTGSEAYRFAHGNRKGNKLTYEQADEIARLHSAMKSYRRRQRNLEDWLTEEVREDFVNAVHAIKDQVTNP